MNYWAIAFTMVGGTTGAIAVLGWVGVKVFDSFVAARGDAFRAKLQHDAEAHKADLERASKEHSVRFERLHDKRAEAIEDLHKHLYGLRTMLKHVAAEPVDEAAVDRALDSLSNLMPTILGKFEQYTIYLPSGLCNKIETMLSSAQAAVAGPLAVRQVINAQPGMFKEIVRTYTWEKELAAARKLNEQVQATMRELVQEFRGLMGES